MKPRCPYCDQELSTILASDHFRFELNEGGEWIRDDYSGDLVCYCPHCDAELDYDFLEEIGVF